MVNGTRCCYRGTSPPQQSSSMSPSYASSHALHRTSEVWTSSRCRSEESRREPARRRPHQVKIFTSLYQLQVFCFSSHPTLIQHFPGLSFIIQKSIILCHVKGSLLFDWKMNDSVRTRLLSLIQTAEKRTDSRNLKEGRLTMAKIALELHFI